MLLSRDDFREGVFARDAHQCVICKALAQDAHHIIERRLFPDGGYYLNNGASLCGICHILAEETTLTCEQIRTAAGITEIVLPPHLYHDQRYDKWGNPILENGLRLRGELFNDESVQKVLKQGCMLGNFTSRVKYPRTYHFPWSNPSSDDRVLPSLAGFEGQEVVLTEKMDGENTNMYRDYIHARSTDFNPHPSRAWVKALHARIAFDIPEGWRVCGENLYAVHSIRYERLEDYFQVFSIWTEKNECLSWEDTLEWAALLDLRVVPLMWCGIWDEQKLRALADGLDTTQQEGYVCRVAHSFHYREFRNLVGKYVRPKHVQTHGHWMRTRVENNQLRGSNG
jgi:hypothetical protein